MNKGMKFGAKKGLNFGGKKGGLAMPQMEIDVSSDDMLGDFS